MNLPLNGLGSSGDRCHYLFNDFKLFGSGGYYQAASGFIRQYQRFWLPNKLRVLHSLLNKLLY